MTLPDVINGVFEGTAGLFVLNSCRVLVRDKVVRGISIPPTVFFTSWGFWNLFDYPNLHQWLSFVGGLSIVSTNCLWLALWWRYR